VGGFALTKSVSVLSTIVLAHLLLPSDFGLVAIAGLVAGGISLFTSGGLGNALILRGELDSEALAAAFALMLALGAGAAALGVLVAPLAARAFDAPRAEGILVVIAGLLAYSGVWSFYEALIRRELKARALFAADLLQALIYIAVAIPLAIAGTGVWSLVGGQVAGSLAYTITVLRLAPFRLWPRWRSGAAREFWRTGKGFLLHTSLWWASSNMDYVVVGRFVGLGGLGAYSLSYRFVEVPNAGVADPVAQVSFPSFALLRQRGADVVRPYLRVLGLVALAAPPLAILLSATARPFVATMLGGRWHRAVGPLTILGIWGAILPLSTTGAWLVKSLGHPMTTAKIHGATLALFIGPLVAAAVLGGLTAVAAVMLARGLATYALVLRAGRRTAALPLSQHLGVLRGVGPGCAAAWLSAHTIAAALSASAAPVALAVSGGVGLIAYLATVSVLDAPLLNVARSQLRLALSRSATGAEAGGMAA
jgi:PST family polysaccharide transporter